MMASSLSWQFYSKYREIKLGQAHLWRVSFPEAGTTRLENLPFFPILNEEERDRAQRFKFPKDQIQFVLCRGLLRHLLGAYQGQAPETLQFIYGEQGKPALVGQKEEPGLHFNLSHSHGKALLAFSPEKPVGVDLEKVDENKPLLKLVQRYFTPQENQFLRQFSGKAQNEAAYKLWTLKEAYLKAQGLGLSKSLDSFQMTWQGAEEPRVQLKDGRQEVSSWTLKSFTPFVGYVAGIAVPQPRVDWKFFEGNKILSNF